jgi:Phosphopantetheine attachment site.
MTVTDEVNSVNLDDSEFTPIERKLAAIWCRVLKLKAIDVHENFFDLGG